MPHPAGLPEGERYLGLGHGLSWARLLVAIAAIPVFALALIADGLQTPHSFDSAWILMEARIFAEVGILPLHGLPVVDNPPLIHAPYYYPNWPPLAAMILSRFAIWFDDGIRGPQILMASFSFAIAVMIAWAFRNAERAGIAAGVTFLLTPWTMTYGFHVSMLIFGMLFGVAACLAWTAWTDRRLAGRPKTLPLLIGCGFMFLAMLSSWDPFFLLPGLVVASSLTGQLRQSWRGLLAYAVSSMLAVGVTFALYASQASGLFAEIGRKFLYRAGLGLYAPPFSPYLLANDRNFHPGLRGYLTCAIEFLRHSVLLGPVALTALPFALLIVLRFRKADAFRRPIHLIVPLLSMWLGWALVFVQQAMLHEYEAGAGAMAAAASVGVVWAYLSGQRSAGPSGNLLNPRLLAVGLGLILLFGAAPAFDDRLREIGHGSPEATLGTLVERSTERGALVLATERSAIAAYVSKRHMIRGVSDETVVLGHPGAFRELCPECPLYLAIRPGERARFARMLADREPLQASGQWEVYKLGQPGQPLASQ